MATKILSRQDAIKIWEEMQKDEGKKYKEWLAAPLSKSEQEMLDRQIEIFNEHLIKTPTSMIEIRWFDDNERVFQAFREQMTSAGYKVYNKWLPMNFHVMIS
ncbi:MAG: hypothetical protein K2X95_01490 [Flavobacteriaceae bacterium]|nr:hypothetical protein [Flavobacteriaceae bacterium]